MVRNVMKWDKSRCRSLEKVQLWVVPSVSARFLHADWRQHEGVFATLTCLKPASCRQC